MQLRPQFLILFASLVALVPHFVNGECCPTEDGKCKDGGDGTPCCGTGNCNVFCCDCEGGCRRKHDLADRFRIIQDHIAGSHTDHPCYLALAESDINGDGKITFMEWVLSQAVEGGNPKALAEHWAKFDWEDKGYLTFQEVYERKA